MNYWLVKSEPDVYSIDVFAKEKRTLWDGVRNYQARNFLRSMEAGDEVFFYHSSCDKPGITGIARVSKAAVPDPTQFDPKSDYYDKTARKEEPRWFCPELVFVRRFARPLGIDVLRKVPQLKRMKLFERGSRLSVQPVTKDEYQAILGLAE